jgi:hypothetical protein
VTSLESMPPESTILRQVLTSIGRGLLGSHLEGFRRAMVEEWAATGLLHGSCGIRAVDTLPEGRTSATDSGPTEKPQEVDTLGFSLLYYGSSGAPGLRSAISVEGSLFVGGDHLWISAPIKHDAVGSRGTGPSSSKLSRVRATTHGSTTAALQSWLRTNRQHSCPYPLWLFRRASINASSGPSPEEAFSELLLPVRTPRRVSAFLRIAIAGFPRTSLAPNLPTAWVGEHFAGHENFENYALPTNWWHPRFRHCLPPWLPNLALDRPEMRAISEGFSEWSRVGREIEEALIPTVRSAGWRERAGQIMHELVNTVSLTDAPMQAVATGLDRAILDLRYFHEEMPSLMPAPTTPLAETIDGLRGTVANLDFLRKNHEVAKNKVLWYFFMAEGRLRGSDSEELTLKTVIADTLQRLGITTIGYQLLQEDSAPWQVTMAMPPQFLGHSWQALLSNAVRHREPGSSILVSATQPDPDRIEVRWQNPARDTDLRRVREVLSGQQRESYGMAVAREVAREFFAADLRVAVSEPERLITHELTLSRCASKPTVFFSLGDMLERRRTPSHSPSPA